jgi:hypothetical protein
VKKKKEKRVTLLLGSSNPKRGRKYRNIVLRLQPLLTVGKVYDHDWIISTVKNLDTDNRIPPYLFDNPAQLCSILSISSLHSDLEHPYRLKSFAPHKVQVVNEKHALVDTDLMDRTKSNIKTRLRQLKWRCEANHPTDFTDQGLQVIKVLFEMHSKNANLHLEALSDTIHFLEQLARMRSLLKEGNQQTMEAP